MVQLQWQLQCLWESVVLGFVIFLFLFFLAKGVRRAYWDGSTVISLFDYCDF